MQKRITASVIIPFYKRLDYLFEAIKSVQSQHLNAEQIEIICCDEEQNIDHQKKIKQNFPNIKIVTNKFEEGPGGNRTTGLVIARGKYIIFLDSDDVLEPDFITDSIKRISRDSNVGATVCLSNAYFEQGFNQLEKCKLYFLMYIRDFITLLSFLIHDRKIYKSGFYLCQISHMLFVAKDIKGHKFNYDYRWAGEDWDFFVQLLQHKDIMIIPKRLTRFRYHVDSSTMSPQNKKLKWKSYRLLNSRLPKSFKDSVLYTLFKSYINLFEK